jgi:hypothetical protein
MRNLVIQLNRNGTSEVISKGGSKAPP